MAGCIRLGGDFGVFSHHLNGVYTTKLTSLITFFKRFSYFEPVTSDPSDPGGVS